MDNIILKIQKIAAKWWARIILFILSSLIIATIISFLFNFLDSAKILFISLLIPSILIEISRKESHWYTFGVKLDYYMLRDILSGIIIVLFSLLLIIAAGLLLGAKYSFNVQLVNESFSFFLFTIFFASVSEELLFRGIIFQAVLERFSAPVVIVISSILFAIGHLANPNVSALAVINIFLFNISMSLMYYKTRSLWLPIAFHFLWNFSEQMFLNSPISGYDYGISFFNLNFHAIALKYRWLIGTDFGIEEGLMTTLVLILTIPVLFKLIKPSPYMLALLFKRSYSESKLLYRES